MAEWATDLPYAPESREEAALSARSGDKQAFAYLVRECERTLYRVSRTVLRSDADCADAVQEALARAWAYIGTLREPKHFQTWLVRILLNECYALLRRGRRAAGGKWRIDPPMGCAPDEDIIDLKHALEALPESQRTALVLCHVEGFTVEETARILRIPKGTVKSRLARGRAKLAEELRPKED